MTEEELRKKVELLERENEQLKSAKRPSEYSVREDKFKGHPVLVFEGPSLIKPMTLGIGKLKAVAACLPTVQEFLRKRDKNTSHSGSNDMERI